MPGRGTPDVVVKRRHRERRRRRVRIVKGCPAAREHHTAAQNQVMASDRDRYRSRMSVRSIHLDRRTSARRVIATKATVLRRPSDKTWLKSDRTDDLT